MARADFEEQVVRRLDVLIGLLLEKPKPERPVNMTERIMRLSAVGLPPAEIGQILGKKTNYVTGMLAQKKKGNRKAKTPQGQ